MNDPHSHLFRVAMTSDGATLLWVMGMFGVAIVLDVFINDWTPERIKIGSVTFRLAWRRAFQHRHFLFIALAFCYAAQPYVAERGGYGVSLLIFFYWNSLQNIVIAFLDAKQRTRGTRWQRATSS
jgi:hypothetical protein